MSPFKHIFPSKILPLLALGTAVASCIPNNIDYPKIHANFATFAVENELQAANIDTMAMTVKVFLNESADIRNVKVSSYSTSPEGVHWADSAQFESGIDLSQPLTTTLSLYQDYKWTISAVQNFARYFAVNQQIGATAIDTETHTVTATVSQFAPISHLYVDSIKLAGPTAIMEPDLNGEYADFSSPVEVKITEFGQTSTWTVTVLTTESAVTTDAVDAWSCVAWLYGTGEATKENGFEYRRADQTAWSRLPKSQVTVTGGSFSARLSGLTPETSYIARAYSDDEYGQEIEFTTQATAQMPNSDFENWWRDGKIWCPWAEGATPYWGTGNKGATTLGDSNSVPSNDTPTGSGRSAQLESKFVGFRPLGKLAAGNLFVGDYVRTEGTNGVLAFGRPFELRPTHLTGYYKYHSATISDATTGFENLKGRPDTCVVWIALVDCDTQVEIRTKPSDRKLFDPKADYVIAYGCLEMGKDVTNWTQFDIELDYVSTSRKPKFILCTASASKYGDYFTGGDGSLLYIDNLNLEYDY